jgi:hypothetical protein
MAALLQNPLAIFGLPGAVTPPQAEDLAAQAHDALAQKISSLLIFSTRVVQSSPSQQLGQVQFIDASLVPTRVTEAPTVPESPEMRWLLENSRRVEEYAGEWLLIADGELVAHSNDIKLVKRIIREHNLRSPFVYRVPNRDESSFVAI